jgi:transglutaminase-like putative cysteine protease
MSSTLEIRHETHYAYSAPVSLAHHLAHLQPIHDDHQQLLTFDLNINPEVERRNTDRDSQGNSTCWFSLTQPHQQLTVVATSRVRLEPRFDALRANASPAWDKLAERLRYVAQSPFEPALAYAQPSPFVPRLDALRDYAAPSLWPGRPVAEAAIELMQRVHSDFTYETASTQIDTPLAQAFAQRRGVCQDFAHLMAGALRMHGLPVRYVSGYLLTHSDGDAGPAMVGADASHAWVQVWCPGTPGVPADGWLDLDPTNNVVPGTGHVRVAVGRDFGDVTPLRGVIRGGGHHTLAVAVSTRRVE